MDEIDLKNAKCTKLSFNSVVNFAKEDGELSGFEIDAYTGEVVDRWWGKLAIEIAGIKAKQQIPIFRDHNSTNIVGHSTKTTKDGNFKVFGVFSKQTETAKEVMGLAAEGFPWQASIGVRPRKIVEVMEKNSMMVNGKSLKGPAQVWLESEVVETSFVPLGADSYTSVSVFSGDERAMEPNNKNKDSIMTLEEMKRDHEDLVAAIVKEALTGMEEKLAQAKADGAAAEQQRIKEVKLQLVPGHEALVEQMAFDGKSTAADAALAIVAAEKTIRAAAAKSFKQNAPPVVPVVTDEPPAAAGEDLSKPIDERAKASWDKSQDLRDEFRTFTAYLAFRKAEDKGLVKLFRAQK